MLDHSQVIRDIAAIENRSTCGLDFPEIIIFSSNSLFTPTPNIMTRTRLNIDYCKFANFIELLSFTLNCQCGFLARLYSEEFGIGKVTQKSSTSNAKLLF